jgi:Rod binding domain-containing protein
MDSAKLILTEPVSAPAQLEHLAKSKLDGATDEKKKQIAKDFESVLLNKLFDQMSKSVGNWGFEKDGASEQVQGIFWLYLAQDLADKGGMGLWKDIYKSLTHMDQTNAAGNALDGKI